MISEQQTKSHHCKDASNEEAKPNLIVIFVGEIACSCCATKAVRPHDSK